MTKALVHDGTLLGYRPDSAVNEDQATIRERGKPYLVDVVDTADEFDPASQVQLPVIVTVADWLVTRHTPARDKTSEELAAELDAARDAKNAELSQAFVARAESHILFEGNLYHAGEEALRNIMGASILIMAGAMTNPRPWTPVGALQPETINVVALGGAIAQRKDELHVQKKLIEASMLALSTAAEVEAFDANQGWE